jgi:uncharacterized protein YbbC (DUF1343 family)
MRFRFIGLITVCFLFYFPVAAQTPVVTGAERMEDYLPLLQNKNIALVVNATSQVNGVLLPDTLLKRNVHIVKIFSPEHGFRGKADAGAEVKNGTDPRTQLPVVSLYGNNKKPTAAQLKGVDLVVYDLQDVGVRFYTYISTLQYVMESCGEQKIPLLLLDRPDPLGFIVDGPVLKPPFRSFVGMQPVPVIYGMTPGEYARMLIGENWLGCPAPELKVIICKHYNHQNHYQLPVMPSPNLKNMAAVYLYPSLCFFEGTAVSVGRGTDFPFQQFGHPDLKNQPSGFTPVSMLGATHPPFENRYCHGQKIADSPQEALTATDGRLNLKWLLSAYKNFPDKEHFFKPYFEKLVGNDVLRKQIREGLSEAAIRKSWQPELDRFKKIREKYLLYP